MWVHFGDVVIVTDAVTAATTAGGGNSICTFGTRCTSGLYLAEDVVQPMIDLPWLWIDAMDCTIAMVLVPWLL